MDLAGEVIAEFVKHPTGFDFSFVGSGFKDHYDWSFVVGKRISKLKMAGLVAGSLVIAAVFIQGSISILAWIARGFKGSDTV